MTKEEISYIRSYAYREARKELISRHKAEYTAIYQELCKKAGLATNKTVDQKIAELKRRLAELEGK